MGFVKKPARFSGDLVTWLSFNTHLKKYAKVDLDHYETPSWGEKIVETDHHRP